MPWLGGERVNPNLLVGTNRMLLVGFAAGSAARNKLPYVTQFDLAASGGAGEQGKFESVQPDAAISLELGSSPLAATAVSTVSTVEVAGPTLSADPLIGEHAIWSMNEAGPQGDLELASSPQSASSAGGRHPTATAASPAARRPPAPSLPPSLTPSDVSPQE